MSISILKRDSLQLGGFAGLLEHRLVMSPKVFGEHVNPNTSPGIGNFVYLADARFNPKGDTRMHNHQEVDVVSIMAEGRIAHEGSLEHGQELVAYDVQVQRAGGEGFSHNEINPDDFKNRMIQIWVLPEKAGESAGYKLYKPEKGSVTRVYGGSKNQNETFDNHTVIDIVLFNKGQEVAYKESFIAYLTQGNAVINDDKSITEGDLISGSHLDLRAETDIQLIVVHQI